MKNILIIAVLTATLFVFSCRKKDPPICSAGKGGNVTCVVYANHGGPDILNYYTHLDTTFVKFNATTSPGTLPSKYDVFYISEPGEDHIHCTGLKCGQYYLYRTAWDSVTNTRYYGGLAVDLTETSGEKDLDISVH